MRDHVADKKSEKKTLVVKIGIEKAKDYHRALIFGGILLAIIFVFPSTNYFNYIFVITIPIFVGFVQSIRKRIDFENFEVEITALEKLYEILENEDDPEKEQNILEIISEIDDLDAEIEKLKDEIEAEVEEKASEIEADIPNGAPEQVIRTVTENAHTLKFTEAGFEEE
jgi:hypothetical protein